MENKYDVVKRDIKEKILSGHYSINDRLPTEASLMEQYALADIQSDERLVILKRIITFTVFKAVECL